MAATTTFPTLPVPQEDSMDMSSPHNAYNDGDIDIDFDTGDFGGSVDLPEDERMLTDGEQTRPGTATDDVMEDDVQINEVHVEEAVMDDDITLVAQITQYDDEELIDYDDEEPPQQTGDQALQDLETVHYGQPDQPASFEQPQELVEQVNEEILRQPEAATAEELEPTSITEPVTEAAFDPLTAQSATAKAEQTEAATTAPLTAEEDVTGQAFDDVSAAATACVEPARISEEQAAAYDDDTQQYVDEAEIVERTLALETSLRAGSVEAPGTPTDTGLHPMTLSYEGMSMPLFKSKRQLDGLLKDDNLANLSLHELMHNIRERLARRIGNVPEEQELTLAFDHMNLLLVGNSRAAFEYSLSDVLAVYLTLHQNDGLPAEEIPSLSLILTQNHFSSQLSWLKQAASSGVAMSTVVQGQTYPQPMPEQDAEDGDATYEEHEQQEEYYEHGEDGEEGAEHARSHQHEEQDEQGEEYYQPLEDESAAVQEASEAQNYEEQVYEQHEAKEQEQEAYVAADAAEIAELAESDEPVVVAETGELGAAKQHEALPPVTEEITQTVSVGEERDEAESDASSATLNGQAVDESTGEYDVEDLIDWDDDSDLTSPISEPAKDGHDDLPLVKGHEHTEHPAVPLQDADVAAQHAENEYPGTTAATDLIAEVASEKAHYEGSGDLATELQQPQPEGAEYNQDDQEYDTQLYQDQADAFEAQQGNFEEPGQEAEQCTGDHDYLDGHSYEHGLEHHPTGEETYEGDAAGQIAGVHYTGDDLLDFDDEVVQPESLYDDIGYNDDVPADAASRKASHSIPKTPLSSSPSVKRSFETAEIDFDFQEPELKKVKSE